MGFDDPVAVLSELPVLVLPLFVLVSALLEYVVPPYWGDTVVLVAFFLAGHGVAKPEVVFAAAFAGSVLGSAVSFLLGRRYGVAILRFVTFRRRPGRRRMQRLLERFGERFLVVNRFVPVVRGLLLYGAGAFGLRFGRSVAYSAVSNALWVGVLAAVGLFTADSWDTLRASYAEVNQLAGIGATLAVAVVVALMLRFLRTPDEAPPGDAPETTPT